MQTSKNHHELTNGIGKCSVPMWQGGCPAGFCDDDAFGKRKPPEVWVLWSGERKEFWNGRYSGYVPGLACPGHGGPKRIEALNLCEHCENHIAECNGSPEFGAGVGNDNVHECDGFIASDRGA